MKRKNELSISEALTFWMKSNGIEQKIFETELKNKWKLLMSESIYNQTYKFELIDNKTILYISSPLIKTEFSHQAKKIKIGLNKILEHFQIEELIFRN